MEQLIISILCVLAGAMTGTGGAIGLCSVKIMPTWKQNFRLMLVLGFGGIILMIGLFIYLF